MITKSKILILLASGGLCFFMAAGFFFDWGWITADWYFRFYAFGLLAWAFRMKMQSISYYDALMLNVVVWLCVFNVFDELLSKTPAKPYKPWIATIVVIVSTLYIHYKKCKNNQSNSKS